MNSIEIRDCDSVDVPVSSGPSVDLYVNRWTIENIANSLIFDLFMAVRELENFKLSNIGEIPFIKKDSFDQLTEINNFHIENTTIGSLEDIFGEHPVKMFTLVNVTIKNLSNFTLINGMLLNITNCKIKVVDGSLVFEKFENISITGTIFEFSNPGNIFLDGENIILMKNTFLNATVQVVANGTIDVRGTCGNGRSSMRLDSPNTTSHGNNLPSQIIFAQNPIQNSANHQCPGGYCKCPRMSDTESNKNQAGTIRYSLFLVSALISYYILTVI